MLLTAGAVGGIFGALLMRFIKLNVNKDYNFITLSCLGAGVSQFGSFVGGLIIIEFNSLVPQKRKSSEISEIKLT